MAKRSMTPKDWIRKGLDEHGQDLLREMVTVFCRALMHADVEALCGAP